MILPERFHGLPEYAFPRLRALLRDVQPGAEPLSMSIGEPRHPFPDLVGPVLAGALEGFGRYPANDGTPDLLEAIGEWLSRRYGLRGFDPMARVLALNGTREGLFAAALALSPERKAQQAPAVLIPNPFYQCYMVAARAAGAEPVFVSASAQTGFLPDYASLPPALLDRVTLAYVCSPANPQGAVADMGYWTTLLALAERHDFIVLADECYSEIWRDTPPPGALQAAQQAGADPERVMVFHSLSKRSNLPGLRAGFAAGGPHGIAALRQLRAYAGAPLPPPVQAVAAACWRDEDHVVASRALYQRKFALADATFGDLPFYRAPQGGFFLWLPVEDGERATRALYAQTGIQVLPGAYLAQPDAQGANPGAGFVRVALVADEDSVAKALRAIRHALYPEQTV